MEAMKTDPGANYLDTLGPNIVSTYGKQSKRQSKCFLDLYCKWLRANRMTREAGVGDKKGSRPAR